MNRTKIITIIVLLFIIFGAIVYIWFKSRALSYSGVISSFSFPTVKTKKYTIDTPGVNPRVYEWDTKTGYHCIAIFRDSFNSESSPSMQCFKK